MAAGLDYSLIRNYLQGQVELGAGLDECYLDEPWAYEKKLSPQSKPVINPVVNKPEVYKLESRAENNKPLPFSENQATTLTHPSVPTPRVVRRSAYAFEAATTLKELYAQIKAEPLYNREPFIAPYLGPENPKVLFLLPAIKLNEIPQEFFTSAVGEMLVRLFQNLNVDKDSIGVTYFFKSTERNLSPLLETTLKKILGKELSFLKPQVMVTFGELLFHQLFGKAKKFDELAGSDLDFLGTKTCALVDPYKMVNDKQMKWLTWKVHIPRSSYFAIK